MLGAASYVADLKHPLCRRCEYNQDGLNGRERREADERVRRRMDKQVERLSGDCLMPLMRQLVFGDMPNLFSPWLARYDRGKALEDAWTENSGGSLALTFEELRLHERLGWCPSLVFTPMMIEDGRRLVISNLDLFRIISNDGGLLDLPLNGEVQSFLTRQLTRRGVPPDEARQLVRATDPRAIWAAVTKADADRLSLNVSPDQGKRLKELIAKNSRLSAEELRQLPRPYQDSGNFSIEAVELFRLFPGARFGMKLATAARMSASFPFFSPAVSLPTWPRRRIVDAGYYDNYGVSLSAAWLFSASNRSWIQQNVSRLCIVQIRDGVSDEFRKFERVRPDASTEFSRALEELVSPLEGLENARVGSSSFRNDGQLELLSQYIRNPAEPKDFLDSAAEMRFAVVNFEYDGRAAMSWRLSKQELDDLRARATDSKTLTRIEALQFFLFDKKRDSSN
jgi:hypothetical protein